MLRTVYFDTYDASLRINKSKIGTFLTPFCVFMSFGCHVEYANYLVLQHLKPCYHDKYVDFSNGNLMTKSVLCAIDGG